MLGAENKSRRLRLKRDNLKVASGVHTRGFQRRIPARLYADLHIQGGA